MTTHRQGVSRYAPTGLYHGTRRPFSRGGLLLPGSEVGAADNHGLDRADAVYLTPDIDLAWAYAEAAQGRGRPRVVEARPLDDDLYVDDSTINGDEQESYRTAAAFIVAVHHERGA